MAEGRTRTGTQDPVSVLYQAACDTFLGRQKKWEGNGRMEEENLRVKFPFMNH